VSKESGCRVEILTCSITSGAIQHGVPTNVFRTLFRVMSPPVAKKALTPKSKEIQTKSPQTTKSPQINILSNKYVFLSN